jgi:hypothetical protein
MNALGPHFAFLTAVPLEALAFVVLGFIPNTRASDCVLSNDMETTEADQNQSLSGQREETTSDPVSFKERTLKTLSHISHDIQHGVHTLGSHKSLLVGLLALVVAKMARPMLELILQYMSVRFGWPLAKVRAIENRKLTEISYFLSRDH